MKWIWVALLVIIGAIAAYVAIEYLTVPIHAVPSFLGPHKGRGHFHKRGALAAVVAVVALGGAGFLTYRNLRGGASGGTGHAASAPTPSSEQLLATPPTAPGQPEGA
jgi:hypothetical protein